jgi:hypothetical protein
MKFCSRCLSILAFSFLVIRVGDEMYSIFISFAVNSIFKITVS